MKTLIQKISALILILAVSSNLFCQEIEFDLTFTGDTVLYPFENMESISEMTLDAIVELSSDTSLVRVVLEDQNGIQYMICESYPLISSGPVISLENYCDETCYLDQVNPTAIIIQVIDAEILLKSLYYSKDPKENPIEERYKEKRRKDAEKIQIMNDQIALMGMNWKAGDNSWVSTYYDDKRLIFGNEYNLSGYDYYSNGVFEFIGRNDYPHVDPSLRSKYDLVFEYIGQGDSLSAFSSLNSIPVDYYLDADESVYYEQTEQFLPILKTYLLQNSIDILDSTQLSILIVLSQTSFGRTSALSRNILVAANLSSYKESYIFPEQNLKSDWIRTLPVKNNSESNDLIIFPNPASEEIQIDIGIHNFGSKGMLELYDITGKLILTKANAKWQKSINLNIDEFDSGVYLIRYTDETGSYKIKKLIVND
jgi:hypothetical protein